jgi:hypothetical protein
LPLLATYYRNSVVRERLRTYEPADRARLPPGAQTDTLAERVTAGMAWSVPRGFPSMAMILEDAHALTIGISRYQHVAVLPPVMDAEDIAAVLTSPHHGAYRAEHVALLCDGAATRAAICDGLDALAARTGPSSTVFVYFSGHGGQLAVPSGGTECYLIPADTSGSRPADIERTALSGGELSRRLRAIRSARLTVVLDCCRASGLIDASAAQPLGMEPALSAAALSPLARGRGRAVFAASRSDGYAYVLDGQRNSLFTAHLLDGLRGAAGGTGGVIRVCDLFHYVQQRVIADNAAQRPVFKAELEENYPVALHRGGEVPVLVLPAAADGFRYDAFVSYGRNDPADRAWVERVLAPGLEGYGLTLCVEDRDFLPGRAWLKELERAVIQSRYTIAVLTPAYLAGWLEDVQMLFARHQAAETGAPRFLPVLRRDCRPSLGIRMIAALDMSDDFAFDADIQRLALQLRSPVTAMPA